MDSTAVRSGTQEPDIITQKRRLTNGHNGVKINSFVPHGMMLIPIAEYERMRQAFLELQQVVNPLFGLDKLQTGKQKRREFAR